MSVWHRCFVNLEMDRGSAVLQKHSSGSVFIHSVKRLFVSFFHFLSVFFTELHLSLHHVTTEEHVEDLWAWGCGFAGSIWRGFFSTTHRGQPGLFFCYVPSNTMTSLFCQFFSFFFSFLYCAWSMVSCWPARTPWLMGSRAIGTDFHSCTRWSCNAAKPDTQHSSKSRRN